MKKNIGKYGRIIYKNRKERISGFIIDSNEEWTLIKSNPVDYIVDGFVIVKTNNIKDFIREDKDKFTEKVLIAKGQGITKKDLIPIDNIPETLEIISRKFGAFQMEFKEEGFCHIGKLVKANERKIKVKEIDPEANWARKEEYKLKDLKLFEFNTDYINSLLLYNKFKDE